MSDIEDSFPNIEQNSYCHPFDIKDIYPFLTKREINRLCLARMKMIVSNKTHQKVTWFYNKFYALLMWESLNTSKENTLTLKQAYLVAYDYLSSQLADNETISTGYMLEDKYGNMSTDKIDNIGKKFAIHKYDDLNDIDNKNYSSYLKYNKFSEILQLEEVGKKYLENTYTSMSLWTSCTLKGQTIYWLDDLLQDLFVIGMKYSKNTIKLMCDFIIGLSRAEHMLFSEYPHIKIVYISKHWKPCYDVENMDMYDMFIQRHGLIHAVKQYHYRGNHE